uniref:Uncharacterized protein n=1 Tax=Lepeophtheirus salmonis TaxID=72036 RepID=A0A0K2USX7_LEPSM
MEFIFVCKSQNRSQFSLSGLNSEVSGIIVVRDYYCYPYENNQIIITINKT